MNGILTYYFTHTNSTIPFSRQIFLQLLIFSFKNKSKLNSIIFYDFLSDPQSLFLLCINMKYIGMLNRFLLFLKIYLIHSQHFCYVIFSSFSVFLFSFSYFFFFWISFLFNWRYRYIYISLLFNFHIQSFLNK